MTPDTTSPNTAGAASRLARKASRLAWMTAGGALVVGLGVPASGRLLDIVRIAGFPLGFYAAAQGAIVLLAALLLVFAARARRLERRAASARSGSGDGSLP